MQSPFLAHDPQMPNLLVIILDNLLFISAHINPIFYAKEKIAYFDSIIYNQEIVFSTLPFPALEPRGLFDMALHKLQAIIRLSL